MIVAFILGALFYGTIFGIGVRIGWNLAQNMEDDDDDDNGTEEEVAENAPPVRTL